MTVRIQHVLKDGTQVNDITGHLIKAADYPVLYEAINRIQKEGKQKKNETNNSQRHYGNDG